MAVPLNAHLTVVGAINIILRSIGEQPVTTVGNGPSAALDAERILIDTSREVQLDGWNCNTRWGIELTRNSDNQFALAVNVLKVDAANPRVRRRVTVPGFTGHFNVSQRRNADDTRYLLYDDDNDTELWPNDTTLTVDIVEFLPLTELEPALQLYIVKKAGRTFQQSDMASRVLFEFTQQQVQDAQTLAMQADEEVRDQNMFRDNPSSYAITYRYNPYFGR